MMARPEEKNAVQIVGVEHENDASLGVATIDVWYSTRRCAWIVERLDRDGSQLGASYRCADEADAAECVAEWLRNHSETHLVSPLQLCAAERRILLGRPRKRAA